MDIFYDRNSLEHSLEHALIARACSNECFNKFISTTGAFSTEGLQGARFRPAIHFFENQPQNRNLAFP